MPAFNDDILGAVFMQNCGMKATCIAYRVSNDIDVQFEDGTIVRHRRKRNFISGQILNPNLDKQRRENASNTLIRNSSCAGETVLQNCGMKATCIAYRKHNEIDVQFEDGTIISGTRKSSFFLGKIQNPNLKINQSKQKERSSCRGLIVLQNCGMKATCIKYNGAMDIAVQFEDGTIIEHRHKNEFLIGSIQNPNLPKIMQKARDRSSCFGVTVLQNCGMKATCIEYRLSDDIDIQFEDGTIVRGTSKGAFLSKQVRNPHLFSSSFPQELIYIVCCRYFKKVYKNYRPYWLKSSITNRSLEIDIYIEDVECGIEYDGYPWHSKETKRSLEKYQKYLESSKIKRIYSIIEKNCIVHESEKHINYQLSCDSSRFKGNYDILIIELEKAINSILSDLGIKECFKIDDALVDKVLSSKIKKESKEKDFEKKTVMQKCGMAATIIAYRNATDIDVQFEDGTVVRNRSKHHFEHGGIQNPNINKSSCLGVTVMQNCGMKASCIVYRGSPDIDVQFEDGTVIKHRPKASFINGNINNPNYNLSSCLDKTVKMSNGQFATCIAYRKAVDIDIKFEDGTIVTTSKSCFEKGAVKNPKFLIGVTRKMNNGENATVIACRGYYDIDIQFEDGTITKHKSKDKFFKGAIANPNMAAKRCLGLTVLQHCGMKASCIAYRSNRDIDVQFEDGTIVKHKQKSSLLLGTIKNPNI